MQFLGIGLPELLLILILAVVVVGPERLPEFAAQLAKFIRQAQAYANYVRKDFTDVIGELEKEVGTSREDLKTIADAFRRETGSVFEEIGKATNDAREAADFQKAAGTDVLPSPNSNESNGGTDGTPSVDSTALKEAAMAEDADAEQASSTNGAHAEPITDEPQTDDWFRPTRSRRKRSDEST
jgi:sec-independent protein translocase protein TatB